MKYKGEKCFFCNEEFKDNDDIVVCPDCGTPYHKECYRQAGECVNHQLHESGGYWQPAKKEEVKEVKEISKIDTQDSSEEKDFVNDIEKDFMKIDLNKPFLGFDPNEDFEGAKMSEIFTFVKTNTLYYIPLFKKMKNMGSKISFNLTSFFFPYFYFANRKMWLMAIISVFVMLVLQIPSTLINLCDNISYGIFDESIIQYAQSVFHNLLEFIENNYRTIETFAIICNISSYIFRFAMCLLGNWLYYRFTIKSVNKIKNRFPDPAIRNSMISNSGGTNAINILFIVLIMLGCSLLFSFFIDMIAILM